VLLLVAVAVVLATRPKVILIGSQPSQREGRK